VFAFGLAHGLGLSTRLQALGLPEDGLVGRILLFNIGVELGQLAALTVIVGLGTLVARKLDGHPNAPRWAFAGLATIGLVAAGVLSFPAGNESAVTQSAAAPGQPPSCNEEQYQPPSSPGGEHPPKSFFRPGERVPVAKLNHGLGDGAVVVHYREDLSREGMRPRSTTALGALNSSSPPGWEPSVGCVLHRRLPVSLKPRQPGVMAMAKPW
jgi:hypothetical protein